MWNPFSWIKTKVKEKISSIIINRILKEVFMWEWLNGKKTVIGSVFLFIALNIATAFGWFSFDPAWLSTLITILTWIGNTLVGGGLTHKVVKAVE